MRAAGWDIQTYIDLFDLAEGRRLGKNTIRELEVATALGDVLHFERCWTLNVAGVGM